MCSIGAAAPPNSASCREIVRLWARIALIIGAAFMKFGRAPTTVRIFILLCPSAVWRSSGKGVEEPARVIRTCFKQYPQVLGDHGGAPGIQELPGLGQIPFQARSSVNAPPDRARLCLAQVAA